MLVIDPETKGNSHLLFVDIFVIAALCVPVFASKVSAFITETAVVAGAAQTGA